MELFRSGAGCPICGRAQSPSLQTQEIAGLSFDIEYQSQFDLASRRTELLAIVDGQADFQNTYAYDHLNRLTVLAQQAGGSGPGSNAVAEKRFDFAYNAASQITKLTRYADTSGLEFVAATHYAYDGIGRLARLTHNASATPAGGWGNDPLAGYQYTYDAASRITAIDSFIDGLTEYDHDATNQLIEADHTGQSNENYAYDANGNRTGGGYSTGDNNQLLSDGTYTYTYDDEGNRLTRTKISNDYVTRYEWDHRNRLVSVTEEDDEENILSIVEHSYDAFNRWVRRSVDLDGPGGAAAVDTFFSYENGQINLQFDDAGDLTHRYAWNPAAVDQILADETVDSLTSAGDVLWPLTDHLGTPRDLAEYDSIEEETTIANHRRYDSYGILISETDSGVDLLIGFTGRPFDESTGLNNHWHRWFTFHVWLNEDPIGFQGGDGNLTRYSANGPQHNVDSLGLAGHTVVLGDGAANAYVEWFPELGVAEMKVMNNANEELVRYRWSSKAPEVIETISEHGGKPLPGVSQSLMQRICRNLTDQLKIMINRAGGQYSRPMIPSAVKEAFPAPVPSEGPSQSTSKSASGTVAPKPIAPTSASPKTVPNAGNTPPGITQPRATSTPLSTTARPSVQGPVSAKPSPPRANGMASGGLFFAFGAVAEDYVKSEFDKAIESGAIILVDDCYGAEFGVGAGPNRDLYGVALASGTGSVTWGARVEQYLHNAIHVTRTAITGPFMRRRVPQ